MALRKVSEGAIPLHIVHILAIFAVYALDLLSHASALPYSLSLESHPIRPLPQAWRYLSPPSPSRTRAMDLLQRALSEESTLGSDAGLTSLYVPPSPSSSHTADYIYCSVYTCQKRCLTARCGVRHFVNHCPLLHTAIRLSGCI